MDPKKLLTAPTLYVRALSEGNLLTNIFFFGVRTFSVLFAVGMFALWCKTWSLCGDLEVAGVIGLIAFQLIAFVALYAATQILWVRASDLRVVTDKDYKVIPILSVFYRLVAEAYSVYLLAIGVAGFLGLLFAGYHLRSALGPFGSNIGYGGNNFVEALSFLLMMGAAAVALLATGYALAEFNGVLVDIARNTRKTAENTERTTTIS